MTAEPAARPLRYVPLGDSYTIGTSVRPDESWPSQLVAALAADASRAGDDAPLELVANPAVDGFTTRDVIAVELPQLDRLRPEVASILIGTNDVIRGISDQEYRRNLERILDDVGLRVGAGRLFGVTSPDYTVTPVGPAFGDPVAMSAGIRRRNRLFTDVLGARGIPVADIFDISLAAASDRSLVAADGLHPSGAQYARWLTRIRPAVETLLGS